MENPNLWMTGGYPHDGFSARHRFEADEEVLYWQRLGSPGCVDWGLKTSGGASAAWTGSGGCGMLWGSTEAQTEDPEVSKFDQLLG